jgi:hypothetical protein
MTCGIASILCLGYVFFKTGALTITSYDITGVPDEYKQAVISGVEDIARTPLYKIIPTNRIITYRGMKIKSLIVDIIPTTQSVTFSIEGLHTLHISVVPYTPLFRIDATRAITKDGIIYRELHDITPLPALELTYASSTTVMVDGIPAQRISDVPETFFKNVAILLPKVNSVIFTVTTISLDQAGDIELKNNTSSIKYTLSSDVTKVWSNLVSAIDTEPLKSKLTDKNNKLEYLDARFGNKVFFKFTNDVKTPIMPTYATSTATTTVPR